MAIIEMKVPVIGESINEVTLSQWLKADGSFVKIDEPICEFESDKATLEFPAEAEGKLIHVAKEGDDLTIGALVARIDTGQKGGGEGQEQSAESEAEKKGEGEGGGGGKSEEQSAKSEGEKKGEGEGERKSEEQSAKSEEQSATSEQQSAKSEEEKKGEGAGKGAKEHVPIEKGENSIEKPDEVSAHPSPAAAKILREKSVDPSKVEGTGREGRITKEDALKANSETPAEKPAEAKSAVVDKQTTEQKPSVAISPLQRNERREKMSRMRRTIARRLVSAKNNTAMLTTFNEVDMSGIMELRKKYQDQFVAKYGIKLGFMSIFAKACAQALLEKPDVNAHIDGEEFIYHNYVDISFAISTPNGLVVPPIKNIESLRFDEIEVKLKELAEKARTGKLSLEEMSGGTFTITNGGVFGSLLSTPIINEPQSAILGMHNIVERPVVVNGQIVIKPMMYIALSYDHRVIDGSTSVTFLVRVKELIEDPARMVLGI